MKTELTTRVLTTISELSAMSSEWSDLFRRCPVTPFQSPEWVLAWADAFSPEHIRVVEVRSGGTLVGLAPLLIYSRGQEPVLAFMAGGVSDYLDVVVDPQFECEALTAILDTIQQIGGWTTLDLTDLPATSVLERTALSQFATVHDNCSALQLPGTREELLQILSKRQRANLRNASSRLQRAGGGHVDIATKQTLSDCLEDLVRLHTNRWSQLGEPGVLADEKIKNFHVQAAPGMLARGILRIYRLRMNDRTIAILYTLLGSDTCFCYLQGFGPEFAHLSPGTQLMFWAMEDAIHLGMHKFDLLRGDEGYKKHWRAQGAATHRIQLHRSAVGSVTLLCNIAA